MQTKAIVVTISCIANIIVKNLCINRLFCWLIQMWIYLYWVYVLKCFVIAYITTMVHGIMILSDNFFIDRFYWSGLISSKDEIFWFTIWYRYKIIKNGKTWYYNEFRRKFQSKLYKVYSSFTKYRVYIYGSQHRQCNDWLA